MKTLLAFSIGIAIGSAITYSVLKDQREHRFKKGNERFAKSEQSLSQKDKDTLNCVRRMRQL